MTVVSGGDRTDEIREMVREAEREDLRRRLSWAADETETVPWPKSGAALVEKIAALLSENESLRARVEAAKAERDDAVREMEARELHHFEVENERDAALASIEEIAARLTASGYGDTDRVRIALLHVEAVRAGKAQPLIARDARIRRAALEDAADAVDEASGGSVYVYATAAWLRARAAEEGETP